MGRLPFGFSAKLKTTDRCPAGVILKIVPWAFSPVPPLAAIPYRLPSALSISHVGKKPSGQTLLELDGKLNSKLMTGAAVCAVAIVASEITSEKSIPTERNCEPISFMGILPSDEAVIERLWRRLVRKRFVTVLLRLKPREIARTPLNEPATIRD